MGPRPNEDCTPTAVVRRFVVSELCQPDLATTVNVTCAEAADFAGTGAGEELQSDRVCDDWRQVGQRSLDLDNVDRQGWSSFAGLGTPLTEAWHHGECLRDSRRNKTFTSRPPEHTNDPSHDRVDVSSVVPN